MTRPEMESPRILVAGIGNIFLGDDAFGSHVAQRLLAFPQTPGVRVVDFGIRGIDLMYALMDGCEVAILIDAVPRGQPPGTLFLLEPQIDLSQDTGQPTSPMLEAHSMDPLKVLRAVAVMATLPAHLFIVGCEPTPLPQDDMQMELSPPVRAAVDEAILMVQQIVRRFTAPHSDKITHVPLEHPAAHL